MAPSSRFLPRLDALVTAVLVVITACLFAAVANRATLAGIPVAGRRLAAADDLRPVSAAQMINIPGLVYGSLPVRIAVTG